MEVRLRGAEGDAQLARHLGFVQGLVRARTHGAVKGSGLLLVSNNLLCVKLLGLVKLREEGGSGTVALTTASAAAPRRRLVVVSGTGDRES